MHITNAEFYITNVCNLSCNNCNRFNNYNFKGAQQWKDLSTIYSQWAKILTFDRMSIIGGEPFTNPDLSNWLIGLSELWPNTNLAVTTNGTKLKLSNHIIEIMREKKIKLRISLHSKDLYYSIMDSLDSLLVKPVERIVEYVPHQLDAWKQTYNAIKADEWPLCETPFDFATLPFHIQKECDEVFDFSKEKFDTYEAAVTLIDSTEFTVGLNWYTHFHESALKYTNGKFSLYDNDPNKAIKVCDQKFCHAFKDGKLYKCGVAHALSDVIKQFNININDQQKKLFDSYSPAEVGWDNTRLKEYIDDLNTGKKISLCSFCPESYTPKPLGDVSKKKY